MNGSAGDRFAEEFYRARAALGDEPELLGNVLAISCSRVTGADGAGISVFIDGMRLPIGASDDRAAYVERLQFTTAEGPCLHAHQTGTSVRADEAMMRRRWPRFHQQLVTHISYRGVIAVPIHDEGRVWGSADLFFRNSSDLDTVSAELVAEVPVLIGSLMAGTAPEVAPGWLDSVVAVPRQITWIALGLVSGSKGVTTDDALLLIRRHAIATGTTADQTAQHLVARRLHPSDLTP